MAQAGPGKIHLFNHFGGVGSSNASTLAVQPAGDFYAGGEGIADTDAGIANVDSLSGAIRVTGANTDADTTFIGTGVSYDVILNGPLVMECRVQVPDLDTKEIFFGISSILMTNEQLEDILINSSGTVITLVADLCGFYMSDELTASATEWHGVHNGGSTAGVGTAASINLGTDDGATITAGEWQILRLVVETNGTAEWWINGKSKQKVVGAVSTTSDVAVLFACAANTTELVIADLSYMLFDANVDWTI